jgi:NitT/TauT family transport system permease protein
MTATSDPFAAEDSPGHLVSVRRLGWRLFTAVGPFLALFAIWELCVRLGWVPAFILPAPSVVTLRVVEDLQQPGIRLDFTYTLTEVLAGFALAAVIGVVLGALIALVSLIDQMLSPLIVALQSIPKVAVAPVLIIWFGFGIESKIILVALIAFFPILVNAVAGFRSTDTRQLLLMNAMRATALQVFLKVRVFNAIPYLMAGMQIAIVLSVIGAVLGEFLGASRGLGSQILQRQGAMDMVGVFSMLVLLSVMGMALTAGMRATARRLAFWSQHEELRGV